MFKTKFYLKIIVLSLLMLISSNISFASNAQKEKKEGQENKETEKGQIAITPESVDKAESLICALTHDDCGHVGGVDALMNLLFKAKLISPNITKGNCLDIGSGLGHDTNSAYKNGFSNIWGMDIDEAVIKLAKEKYPAINFKIGDALKVNDLYEENFFDFVYLLNVASEIPDKPELFQKLKIVCKPDSIIALLDFSLKNPAEEISFKNLKGMPLYPINIKQLSLFLKVIGFEIVEVNDVTAEYEAWFLYILGELNTRKNLSLAAGFTQDEISFVEKFLNSRIELIKNNKIGGTLIFAKKRGG